MITIQITLTILIILCTLPAVILHMKHMILDNWYNDEEESIENIYVKIISLIALICLLIGFLFLSNESIENKRGIRYEKITYPVYKTIP